MNDNLPEVFRRALAPFAPPTAHNITRTGPCKVAGRHISEAPNSESFAAIEAEANADAREIVRGHTMKRETSGCGPDGWKQWTCSCGFTAPRRYEYQSDMCSALNADEAAHRAVCRDDLSRAVDVRDSRGRV
jgi:hypothetical protein